MIKQLTTYVLFKGQAWCIHSRVYGRFPVKIILHLLLLFQFCCLSINYRQIDDSESKGRVYLDSTCKYKFKSIYLSLFGS